LWLVVVVMVVVVVVVVPAVGRCGRSVVAVDVDKSTSIQPIRAYPGP